MEFLIEDTFASIRPQFQFASSFEDAMKAFQAAVLQDQKSSGADKTAEPDDLASDESSDDDNVDGDDGDADDDSATEDEEEDLDVCSIF